LVLWCSWAGVSKAKGWSAE